MRGPRALAAGCMHEIVARLPDPPSVSTGLTFFFFYEWNNLRTRASRQALDVWDGFMHTASAKQHWTSGALVMANASSAITPQMDRVRQLCEQAMTTTDGIRIVFRVEKYGSLPACKTAARSMQTTFCSLRVRARRFAQKMRGETEGLLLSNVRGEYDNLACVVRPLPKDEGFTVSFVPGYALDMDLEVIDISSGQPLAAEDPALNRYLMLMGRFIKEDTQARGERRRPRNVFSLEELQFLWEHDAEETARMNVPPLPAERSESEYESVDLADLGEDELEIVNPGE